MRSSVCVRGTKKKNRSNTPPPRVLKIKVRPAPSRKKKATRTHACAILPNPLTNPDSHSWRACVRCRLVPTCPAAAPSFEDVCEPGMLLCYWTTNLQQGVGRIWGGGRLTLRGKGEGGGTMGGSGVVAHIVPIWKPRFQLRGAQNRKAEAQRAPCLDCKKKKKGPRPTGSTTPPLLEAIN